MAESDLQSCLPRLRRLGLCLFCNADEGDAAIASALNKVPTHLIRNHSDKDVIKFLFKEILQIAATQLEENDAPLTPDMGFNTKIFPDKTFMTAISELDFTERSVIALSILEEFSEAEAATMMKLSEDDVRRSLKTARTHISREVSVPNNQ